MRRAEKHFAPAAGRPRIAFDALGRLHMAMVNKEKIDANLANTGTHLGKAVTVNQGGVVALPKDFFVRL